MGPIHIARRYNLLLHINEVARTQSTPQTVFQGFCVGLSELISYDRAGLSLYDSDHDCLKIIDMYGPHEGSVFRVGRLFHRNSTHTGWVFDHKATIVRGNLKGDLRFPTDKETVNEGYQSLCSVPLVVRGNSIGVVTLVGAKKNQFSPGEVEIVEQMANQIALAIHSLVLSCPVHQSTKLVCPRCIGAAGGKTTVSKHRGNLSTWGKKGGRGRKRPDFN
ncbi:MAG TPA: GAF domain-containing protein [Terriglobales bacterium]|nr:GAF domain-containing protein [Terriglobales bacterium]